jgi:hypothetical protein
MSAIFSWFAARAVISIGILVGICATLLLRTKEVRAFFPWLKRNGKFLSAFGFGVFVGALVTLCLGERPGDATASLIGAFAGIAAAVGGGLWLWQVQDSKSVERTLAAIESSCSFLVPDVVDFHHHAGRKDDGLTAGAAQTTIDSFSQFAARIKRYEGHLVEIEPRLQDAHAKLERQLSNLTGDLLVLVNTDHSRRTVGINTAMIERAKRAATAASSRIESMAYLFRALAPNSVESWPVSEARPMPLE